LLITNGSIITLSIKYSQRTAINRQQVRRIQPTNSSFQLFGYNGSHVLTDLAGDDSDFVGLCVRQTWVLLVGGNDIVAGNDNDFIVACIAALTNPLVLSGPRWK
jgi:hypothetical protein